MIHGTVSEAAAYPDAALVSTAEFISAHRALLNRYLTAVSPAAGDPGPGTSASTREDP